MVGRQPQVYLPSSQVDYPARANTPVDLSSPATSPEQSPISPDGALSVRQSSPALGQSYSPPKKKQYWLGERIYRRMERGSTSETDGSDDGKLSVRQSKKNNGKKRKSLSAKRATPEPDQVSQDRKTPAKRRPQSMLATRELRTLKSSTSTTTSLWSTSGISVHGVSRNTCSLCPCNTCSTFCNTSCVASRVKLLPSPLRKRFTRQPPSASSNRPACPLTASVIGALCSIGSHLDISLPRCIHSIPDRTSPSG